MKWLLSLLVVASLGAIAEAGPFRNSRSSYQHQSRTVVTPTSYYHAESTTIRGSTGDALDEVNAARARRGLPAFIRDEGLTQAAQACAQVRAERLISGHLPNDFAYLPPGSSAAAAGCGALEPSWGFQSCCQWDRYTYAGAATVRGRDGRLYHHLFVR